MYEYSAQLVRVIDGDTYEFRVDTGFKIAFTSKFRLLGADTPEVFGKNSTPEGKEVSSFVEELLRAQPNLLIRTHRDRTGKYGRYLVDVLLSIDHIGNDLPQPTWLSDYLIKMGKAEKI